MISKSTIVEAYKLYQELEVIEQQIVKLIQENCENHSISVHLAITLNIGNLPKSIVLDYLNMRKKQLLLSLNALDCEV